MKQKKRKKRRNYWFEGTKIHTNSKSTNTKKALHQFFGSSTQCPIKCSGWKMKMPLFLQAAPGMSLGEEFDAPYQALGTIKCSKSENSSVFPKISPCP